MRLKSSEQYELIHQNISKFVPNMLLYYNKFISIIVLYSFDY